MELKQRRLEKGWSQQQLADISGISARTIQRLESGESPGMESLKALSAVFEVPISDLHADFRTDLNKVVEGHLMPSTLGQSNEGSADTAEPFIPRLWRGFFLHLLTAMFVLTWLLVLSLAFAIDRSLIYMIGFVWALLLAIQAWNKVTPNEGDVED